MLETVFQRVVGGPAGRIVPAPPPQIVVVDGDTIKCNDVLCRIKGYDAPEIRKPRQRTMLEWIRGYKALRRLKEHVQCSRCEVVVVGSRKGGFGRDLVRLTVNGVDIAQIAIDEGWGKKWKKGAKIDWGDPHIGFDDRLPLPDALVEQGWDPSAGLETVEAARPDPAGPAPPS